MHRLYEGKTDAATRDQHLADFRQNGDGRCRIMLVSLNAAAVGIDLSCASVAAFVELAG